MDVVRRLPTLLAASSLVLWACASGGGGDSEDSGSPVEESETRGSPGDDGAAPGDAGARWVRVTTEDGPPPTTDAVLVVATDGTLWLHGGRVDGEPVTDLWRFDGEAWQEVSFDGDAPQPRFDHVGVWDDGRDRLVVATGQRAPSELFDDAWAFDPEAGTWEQLADGGPRPRYGSCAAVDGDGRMLVSHGFSLEERFADTWAFDLDAAEWEEVTPAAGPRPAARCLHACGWDDGADELVLFGGRTDELAFNADTWRLGDGRWREVTGEGPSPRVHAGGVHTGDGFLVVGGEGPEGLPGGVWRLAGDQWSIAPGEGASARHSHAMAGRDRVVWVFGGVSGDGDLADLWRLG